MKKVITCFAILFYGVAVFGQTDSLSKYKEYVLIADNCLKQNDYLCAKENYLNADSLQPAEKYVTDRIALCDKNIKKQFNDEINKGDLYFYAGNYAQAKRHYLIAETLNQTDNYIGMMLMACNYGIARQK